MAAEGLRAVGVDVGGTYVKYGLFDGRGERLEGWKAPSARGEALLVDIARTVEGRLEALGVPRDSVAGMGVCAPGPVDAEGTVGAAPAVSWRDFNLPEALGRYTDLPVAALNDGNAAALGEAWRGCAAGCRDFVMLTLGTGIGGGIVMNGQLLAGANGACGEIGHLCLTDEDTPRGADGLRGTFEYYASATGLARIAARYLEAHGEPSALRGLDPDARAVFEAAAAGDGAARRIVARYGWYLGKGMAAVATLLNPERIALGGGVSAAGEALLECARPSFEEHVYPLAGRARLCLAALGNDAGVTGAAKRALDRFDAKKTEKSGEQDG